MRPLQFAHNLLRKADHLMFLDMSNSLQAWDAIRICLEGAGESCRSVVYVLLKDW